MTSKNILITGGSGMIGRRLTSLLMERGHSVSHLVRSGKKSRVRTFLWDPARGLLDPSALNDADVIIHLAGKGIADKRWNRNHKKEIWSSRVDSARLLIEALNKRPHNVKAIISASGISYYGLGEAPDGAFSESHGPADDFMARVTVAWEDAIRLAQGTGIRTVMIRTGVVLSTSGGALEKLVKPVRYLVGAPLGTGDQYVNWIHLEDLCHIYVKAVEDTSMQGVYNAVGPEPVTNRELTQAIADVLKKPLWLPPVPGFVVKLIAGQVAELVLGGGKVSSKKIEGTGLRFKFTNVRAALRDLLASSEGTKN